jgi:hypothetical protein
MTTETTATAPGMLSEARALSSDRAPARRDTADACVISANAAKVLDTTRHAWSEAAADAPKEARSRPPRASQPKIRVVPRRSRWPSLVAALNYWSPKPL